MITSEWGRCFLALYRKTSSEDFKEIDMTLKEAFDYFFSIKRSEGVRERTQQDYTSLFGYFSEWLQEAHPEIERITQVKTQHLRDYVLYLRYERKNKKGENLSPYTVNIRTRFLKAFFGTLHRENIINADPAKHVKPMKTDEKPVEVLTEAELYRLLLQPDKRIYAQFRDLVLMYTLLDTGLRIKEAVNLKVQDIDFKTRAITVPADISKNRRVRILPLTNKTVKLLLELVTENKAHFPEVEYVFLSQTGTPYNENSFRKRLHLYRDKAGITKPVSPHLFRKMFAIEFLNSGGNLFIAQRLLGHQELSTTRRYYHANLEDIKNQHALHSPVVRLRDKYR